MGVRKIKVEIRNYLWLGSFHKTCAKVNWQDCCEYKKFEGLEIIDLNSTLEALLAKWMCLG